MGIKKTERFVVYGALVACFALVAFFDLRISQALYAPSNVFGRIFEILGEVPAYVVAVFGLSLIALFHPNGKRKVDLAFFIVALVLAIGVSVYAGHHTYKLLSRNFGLSFGTIVSWGLKIGLSLPIFALGFLPAKKWVKEPQRKEAFFLGILLIACLAVGVILMQGMKWIWLRPRFRTLMALQEAGAISDASAYWLPFYAPQLLSSFKKYEVGGEYGFTSAQIEAAMGKLSITKWEAEEFYSFPSGHTMLSSMTLLLTFLPRVIPALEKRKRFPLVCRIVAYVYIVAVAFSRIVRGAHNPTDVVAGFLIGFAIVDLGSTFLYERFLRAQLQEAPAGN